MIVSDTHRMIFVHVPKCAGTAIRRALAPLDETGGAFDERVDLHPELGRIDYTHIPLHLLRVAAPEQFEKLALYASFAVCRDPRSRFPSACAQRIKVTRRTHIAALDDDALEQEIHAAIAYLSERDHVTDPDWIHFARQVDFLDLDGARLIRTVIPVERLDALRSEVARQVGAAIGDFGAANVRMTFRHPALRAPLTLASAAAKGLLPSRMSETLRRHARALWLRPAGADAPSVFGSRSVRRFVEDYYADDARAHHDALAAF